MYTFIEIVRINKRIRKQKSFPQLVVYKTSFHYNRAREDERQMSAGAEANFTPKLESES